MSWFQWLVRIVTLLANVLNCPECMKRLREHSQTAPQDKARDDVTHGSGSGA
jgi:hypothetical protein